MTSPFTPCRTTVPPPEGVRPREARPGHRRPRGDDGSAIIEFVWGGVLLLVPLLYVVLAVFEVQRNAFAVTEAAREAGRA
ncbi:hypothetical protein [Cryptosporangium sp. NPDC051539]|uniref:hypothetical protein n=1 Tax=Cryptosporangium sp. NPDC051539 TaxID=3363962 RepID=UPI00378C1D44